MGSCSGSSGIRVGSREEEKEEVARESQGRGWGSEGMKTYDRTDGNTTLEMNNYVAYALPGAQIQGFLLGPTAFPGVSGVGRAQNGFNPAAHPPKRVPSAFVTASEPNLFVTLPFPAENGGVNLELDTHWPERFQSKLTPAPTPWCPNRAIVWPIGPKLGQSWCQVRTKGNAFWVSS